MSVPQTAVDSLEQDGALLMQDDMIRPPVTAVGSEDNNETLLHNTNQGSPPATTKKRVANGQPRLHSLSPNAVRTNRIKTRRNEGAPSRNGNNGNRNI